MLAKNMFLHVKIKHRTTWYFTRTWTKHPSVFVQGLASARCLQSVLYSRHGVRDSTRSPVIWCADIVSLQSKRLYVWLKLCGSVYTGLFWRIYLFLRTIGFNTFKTITIDFIYHCFDKLILNMKDIFFAECAY